MTHPYHAVSDSYWHAPPLPPHRRCWLCNQVEIPDDPDHVGLCGDCHEWLRAEEPRL